MKFYVKAFEQDRVSLMTELGHVLAYYDSVAEALNTCNEWYLHNDREPRQQVKIQSADFEILCDSSVNV